MPLTNSTRLTSKGNTMNTPEVFAVIWEDFIPLSLHFGSRDEAIAKAKEVKLRGGDKIRNVRAVHIPEGTDTLVVLWGPPLKHINTLPTRKGITS